MCTFGVLGLSRETPAVGPKGSGPLSPGFGVWVCGVWGQKTVKHQNWPKLACPQLKSVKELAKVGHDRRVVGFWGLGFWGFGVLGFWGFGVLGFWGFGVLGVGCFGCLGGV